MLIEFTGGRYDGEIDDDPSVMVNGFPSDIVKIHYNTELEGKTVVYRRKPDTNKFYFDKTEEL